MMQHPRVNLIADATPIEYLPHLSKRFGIELSVKRDDLAGPTLGGNKSRQLEFYLGAAQAADADTILITGAVQSNFVRTAAACAAKCGMRTIVQLEARVPARDATYDTSGNVLLNGLLGAEVIHFPEGENEAAADAALRARAEAETNRGKRPYVIPLALGNPPLGALGYIRAAEEIHAQSNGFDFVVVASGSGLTHAGLLAGFHGLGTKTRVIGSCVRRDATLQRSRIRMVLDDLAPLAGTRAMVPSEKIDIWDGALAPGYGQIGEMAFDAMKLAARSEGLLLDPVYTAKAFAALPALVKTGGIPKGSRVLFVHTGGLASLFAYQPELDAHLD